MGPGARSRSPEGAKEAPASKKIPANKVEMRALIVEDDPRSALLASSVLEKLGVSDIQAISNVALALELLRSVVEGRTKMPDVLILDLEFSLESGFEVLRYWKANPNLKGMHVFVWTIMGELQKKMSRLFGVDKVVDKHLGAGELENALKSALGIGKASNAKK